MDHLDKWQPTELINMKTDQINKCFMQVFLQFQVD